MKKIRNIFFQIAALFCLMLAGQSAQAQQKSDLIEALQTNYQIILQLDQINLTVAVGYVDCFCKVISDAGQQDQRCKERGRNANFSQQKINFQGQEVSEVRICTEIVEKLTSRVQKNMPSVRSNLPLITSYQRSLNEGVVNIHLERPQNRKYVARMILPKEITHQELTDNPLILDPLTAQESETILDKHFANSDKIRESFLKSKNYEMLYGKLNSKSVIDYLKDDVTGPLALEIKELKDNNRNISFDAWYTPENLKQLYRQHLVAEKTKMVADMTKDYRRTLDSLPVLNFIQTANPQMKDVLSALFIIEKNAKLRVKQATIAANEIYGTVWPGKEDHWISQFAFLMDNRLGTMNLEAVLKNKKNWSDERISETTSYLVKRRMQQKQRIEFGKNALAVGAAAFCLAPFPGTKALSAVAQFVFKNICMLSISGGTNTYFLLESHEKYQQKIQSFLSSPDGSNQVTQTEHLLEYREDFNSWLIFYALEFLPFYDMGKFLFLFR